MTTVLIVEDDADMRAPAQVAFESAGYRVTTARDGAEALGCLRRSTPDVIVLDLMMPIMDGITFLAERRREGLGEGVPVICVSAAGPELLSRARQLGAVECVHKPTDFDALCALLERYSAETS